MGTWKSFWVDNRNRSTVMNQITSYLNNELKAIHPIYIKIGIGQGDESPITAVILYKDGAETLPTNLPSTLNKNPQWTHKDGSVSEIVEELNNLDDNEAVLAQFALTKTGGDNFTAFLFAPQGA